MKLMWLIAFVCVGVILFILENRRSHTHLTLNHHIIASDKIPQSFHNVKIAFLSDLHNNEIGKNNKKILDLLEQEKPDYVLVGGDMLVAKKANEYKTAITLLKNISEKYTVYCGNGNHEARLLWRASDNDAASGKIYKNYVREMKEAGVNHLSNETCALQRAKDVIYISELDLSKYYYKKLATRQLEVAHIKELLGKCQNESYHILLAHNPAYFDSYAQWGADLTLSGHVHGGILRIPFLGGVIDPAYHLFPKYDGGMYEQKNHKLIVSVGLGTHSIKIRLLNPPKIDMITLKNQ